MKISTTGAANRPAFYDRNPTKPTIASYQPNAVVPHGDTVRITYTVPTGRAALVENYNGRSHRFQVAAPVGRVTVYGMHFRNPVAYPCWALVTIDNTVAHVESAAIQTPMLGSAGMTTEAHTSDAGTGGSMDYNINLGVVEFDA